MNNLIKKILIEWSYRLDDGMINLENYQHLSILREVLNDMKLPVEVIMEVMSNLTESEKESFQAIKIDTKTVSDFGSKQTRDAAIKAGTHKKTDKKDDKTKSDVNVFDEPTDDDIDKKIKTRQADIRQLRLNGEGGAGGAKASYGESQYTEATNNFDEKEFKKENRKTIDDNINEINEREKENKYPTAAEERTLEALGLKPSSKEAKEYLAMRKTWVEQQREEHKDRKIWNKFDKSASGMDTWNEAAFDGAYMTKKIIKKAGMKNANVVQSTTDLDDNVQSQIQKKKDNACKKPKSEDCKYYTKELKYFKKFRKYHDTYAIGEDENGRMMVIHISNKKSDKADDTQANTTPEQRFRYLQEKYGKTFAKSVSKALKKGIEDVKSVKPTTIVNSQNVDIDDNFVEVAELAAPKYIKAIDKEATKPCKVVKSGKRKDLRDNNTKFACWLKDKEIENWDKLSRKQKLKYAQEFAGDKKWREDNKLNEEGIYEPFAKVFIKVGEVGTGGHRDTVNIRISSRITAIKKGDKKYSNKLWPSLEKQLEGITGKAKDIKIKKDKVVGKVYDEHLKRGGDKASIESKSNQQATEVKQTEQSTVDKAYKEVVNTMEEADNKWAEENPEDAKKQGIPPKNGPNKKAYIESVLDALHYNQMIDLPDEDNHKVIQQMGIVGAQASHIRNCLAELSGYEWGDREGLKKHLKDNCKVDAETGKISIKSSGKELMSDEFRTAGTSQKVDSKHGKDMRDCIIKSVNKEDKE